MKDNTTIVSDRADIKIDRQQVLRNIGYTTGRKLPVRITSLVDEYIENAHQLMEPSYSYVISSIRGIRRSCVFIDDSIVFESNVLARMMQQCEKVAVFVATIGSYLEETVIRLAEDSLILQSAVLDAIGSVAVNNVAAFVLDTIRGVAYAQGLCISRRFSPGYCDWTIRQQKEIFRALNNNSAGVHLTEECLMLPRKSISGIIGIGPNNMECYNPCKTCKKTNCQDRRETWLEEDYLGVVSSPSAQSL